jgi:putative nucleotidyltransferase with HDIG domain
MDRVACGVVVYRWVDGVPFFLLLENAKHRTWGFPKGHLEEGESLDAAAIRECKEETGHKPGPFIKGFRKKIAYDLPRRADRVRKTVFYYLAELESEPLRISEEHRSYCWAPRLEGRARLQFDGLREVLDCAFTTLAAHRRFAHEDVTRARELLDALSEPEEAWRMHSIKVAEVARRIAEGVQRRCADLPVDSESVEAAALLHDIGRSRDHGIEHPQAGVNILFEQGLGHLAKPCLSHWLKGRKRDRLERNAYFTPLLLDKLFSLFDLDTMTFSEKIISLADSLVQHDTPVRIEARYREARKRYGNSDWMRYNEKTSQRFMEEIEACLGEPLYAYLGL